MRLHQSCACRKARLERCLHRERGSWHEFQNNLLPNHIWNLSPDETANRSEGRRRPSRRGRKPAKAKIYPAQSLRDAAYEAIKHRIITLAFKPGEYVNELQLSAMLGIGRTPV